MIKSDRFGFTVESDDSSKKAFIASVMKAFKAIPENATDVILSADVSGFPEVTYQIAGKKPTNRQLKIRAGDAVIVGVENGDKQLRIVESTWEVNQGEWMVHIEGLGIIPLSECQPTHIIPCKGK